MSLYEKYCLPHLINLACGMESTQKQRQKVVPLARGRVLEIGMGPGLNIPFYDSDNVEMVWGLEPSEGMRKKARSNLERAPFEVRWLNLPSEEIPLENGSADTVVLTYTLCSIDDWLRALTEMKRVLKPGGQLIFCEHGSAPDESVRKWQERINPFWRKFSGGCNLNRPIDRYIRDGGFDICSMESEYLPGPKFTSFEYWGVAKPDENT